MTRIICVNVCKTVSFNWPTCAWVFVLFNALRPLYTAEVVLGRSLFPNTVHGQIYLSQFTRIRYQFVRQ